MYQDQINYHKRKLAELEALQAEIDAQTAAHADISHQLEAIYAASGADAPTPYNIGDYVREGAYYICQHTIFVGLQSGYPPGGTGLTNTEWFRLVGTG